MKSIYNSIYAKTQHWNVYCVSCLVGCKTLSQWQMDASSGCPALTQRVPAKIQHALYHYVPHLTLAWINFPELYNKQLVHISSHTSSNNGEIYSLKHVFIQISPVTYFFYSHCFPAFISGKVPDTGSD